MRIEDKIDRILEFVEDRSEPKKPKYHTDTVKDYVGKYITSFDDELHIIGKLIRIRDERRMILENTVLVSSGSDVIVDTDSERGWSINGETRLSTPEEIERSTNNYVDSALDDYATAYSELLDLGLDDKEIEAKLILKLLHGDY